MSKVVAAASRIDSTLSQAASVRPSLGLSLSLSQPFGPGDDLSMTSNKFSGEFASIEAKGGKRGRARARASINHICPRERRAIAARAALAADNFWALF